MMERVVMACPAKLYRIEEDGTFTFNYEGCL
jgi:ferredoxin-like protein FixX